MSASSAGVSVNVRRDMRSSGRIQKRSAGKAKKKGKSEGEEGDFDKKFLRSTHWTTLVWNGTELWD